MSKIDFTNLIEFANEKGIFNLDVNNQLSLPFHLYLKDRQGRYLGCNDMMAKYEGLTSSNDLIGMTDFEIVTETEAKFFRENDREIMQTAQPKLYLERITRNNRQVLFISQKAPLLSKMKKVIGIVGLSLVRENDTSLILKYGLTKRQYDCFRYLAKGLTAKQIANEMLVSPRTVEHHIVAIKTKLNCRSRGELMEKAQLEFITDLDLFL